MKYYIELKNEEGSDSSIVDTFSIKASIVDYSGKEYYESVQFITTNEEIEGESITMPVQEKEGKHVLVLPQGNGIRIPLEISKLPVAGPYKLKITLSYLDEENGALVEKGARSEQITSIVYDDGRALSNELKILKELQEELENFRKDCNEKESLAWHNKNMKREMSNMKRHLEEIYNKHRNFFDSPEIRPKYLHVKEDIDDLLDEYDGKITAAKFEKLTHEKRVEFIANVKFIKEAAEKLSR